MSFQFAAFVVVVIFVVGWFALGTHYNVRKGDQTLRWLQEGLPSIGEKSTLRWLGSSVVELKIQQAKAPFRDAEVLVVLEPRDVALLWWLARLRGRRDLFIFRGTLRKQPRLQLEAVWPGCWSLRGPADRAKDTQWTPQPIPAPLAAFAPAGDSLPAGLLEAPALDGCPLVRLAVRRATSSLEVQWRLDDVRRQPASAIFDAVRRLTDRL